MKVAEVNNKIKLLISLLLFKNKTKPFKNKYWLLFIISILIEIKIGLKVKIT